MRLKLFLLLAAGFFCLFSGYGSDAQGVFRVIENESRIELGENQANVFLVVENPGEEFSAEINLEALAPNDSAQGSEKSARKIGRGKQILQIPFKLNQAAFVDERLLWYRLRYEISAASNPKTEGIVSFSQLFPEMFELKVLAGDALEEKFYRVRVQAVNPFNQKAISDVRIEGEIEIEDSDDKIRKIRAQGKTDAQGAVVLEFDLPKMNFSDDLELKVVGKKNGLWRKTSDDLPNYAAKFVHVQTDKPIYQPDQTVNLRLSYTKLDHRPVKDAELTVKIENEDDDDDEEVFSQNVKTSRFGIASVSWKIPAAAKLGDYQITVSAHDDDLGFQRIKITRYDLPNFSVEAKPDKAFYLPNEKTAKVEVRADYLFGKPVERAKIRIAARKQSYDDDKIPEITGAFDAEGKFTAEINLAEAFENFEPNRWNKFKDLQFLAFVKDLTTNKTEQRRFDVRITKEPIHVYLIGASYNVSPRLPLKLYVSTFYADGTPAACEVGVYERIEKDTDKKSSHAEIGRQLARLKTNLYGVARLDLPVQLRRGEDELPLKIVARDKAEKSGSSETEVEAEEKHAIQVLTDKVAYRKGEPVKISILSSKQSGSIFVDIVRDYQLLRAVQAKLENGRAEIVLPFQKEFINNLTVAAHFEDEQDDDELIVGSKTIIFPTANYLQIEAKTEKTVFRPGEETTVKFRSRTGGKKGFETALGILVVDKAVEDRARSESELSDDNSFLNQTFASPLSTYLGGGKVFGNLSPNDIKNLNPSRVSSDMAVALEIALLDDRYRPRLSRSASLSEDVETVFTPYFREKMNPISAALAKVYSEKQIAPPDENSLRSILLSQKIDFSALRDAWGNGFRTDFRIERDSRILEIWSAGADKTPKTPDDLTVFKTSWRYFEPTGNAINKAMLDYTQRTGGFIIDYKTLRGELLKQNINLDNLRDAFGNPYRFEFSVNSTDYVLTVRSIGANGRAEQIGILSDDDFTVWTNRIDYFTAAKANLIKKFDEFVEKNPFPKDESEMQRILREIGFNLGERKDAFGHAFYVQRTEYNYPARVYRYEDSGCQIVSRKIISFAVKSPGRDGISGNDDDFEMARFYGAAIDEEIDAKKSEKCFWGESIQIFRNNTIVTPHGAISGTVIDPNGAVIPNVIISVKNESNSFKRTVQCNENGYFLIDNLPKDIYTLTALAISGFAETSIVNLTIEPGVLIELRVEMRAGGAAATVDVSVSDAPAVETSGSKVSTTVTRSRMPGFDPKNPPTFTPRVRNYFAETLVWSPELVTDKKGKAGLKFKFADSLTTWKLYAVGSNENGEFGIAERELQTFQPFFAELDPPRILTEGDEIALPVPVRNYTAKRRKVSVSIAENDWSTMLGDASQNIEVAANSTKNAIFNFRTASPVTDGKQKVTALAKGSTDAIEKPITVKPNGRENVETESKIFQNETGFNVNFPADSYPKTRRAEIKIYPNMLAHVAESVEGLLKRPYGCGEQTTSSTYPNLLILKIEKELKKSIPAGVKAQARVYLEEGYRRLLDYQTDSGGFSYWGKSDAPNAALTAYVLRFLSDAEDFIEVDEKIVENAEGWLLKQQEADGSWKSNKGNIDVSTVYIARSLSLTASKDSKALQSAVEFLKKRLPEIKDDYVLANLGLTALEIGDEATAKNAIDKLTEMKVSSWTTNSTPFNGWGKPAEIETTALVVQLLIGNSRKGAKEQNKDLISKATLFLLKNKDKYGVWYSTQTTVNVLNALVLLHQDVAVSLQKTETAEIFVNGKKAREFEISGEDLSKPFIFDASTFLSGNENQIVIKGLGEKGLTMAQIVAEYYTDWKNFKTEDARWFDLKIDFDKTQSSIGEEITCNVALQSKTNRYGMILAEIGLPPGADVNRDGLEKARLDNVFSRYDVLPDKIVIYLWAGSNTKRFSFKFRPRFGLNAQTAPSIVYDYYNEEARATVAPVKFSVK